MAEREPYWKRMSAEDLRARTAALERFAAWEMNHPPSRAPEQALEGIGFL